MSTSRYRRIAAVFTVCTSLIACSSTDEEKYVEQKVEVLYNTAVSSLEAGDYKDAAKQFDEVERQHPYSVWATKAQLMAAFSQYQANQYDEAVIGLDRFIRLHPGNRDIAYAYYLKAISYYERISDVSRDQLTTEQALTSLREIVRRFPNSKYARDASLKIDLTRDHLAGKEMEIGRFYLNRNHYLAAINRFRQVIDKYQTTTHVPEALHRLVEAYRWVSWMKLARSPRFSVIITRAANGISTVTLLLPGRICVNVRKKMASSPARGTGCSDRRCLRRFQSEILSLSTN